MESRKKRKKRSKRAQNSKFRVRVRYKYHYYRWINTPDYGSFKDIYEKYKDKGYTFWCLPKGDPVFTNPGISSIGDQIDSTISVNGTYEVPSKLLEREYEGDLVVVKPSLLPEARLTPEHPVLACGSKTFKTKWYDARKAPTFKAEWKPAGELTSDDWVYFPTFKGERSGDPQLLYLLGLYMAEGYCTGGQVVFSLGKKEGELAQKILALGLRFWNVKGSVVNHRTGLMVRFSKPSLASFLAGEFGKGALNKKIPPSILEQKDPLPFLKGWVTGDGYFRGNGWRLSTSSKTAAYQAILLCSRIGMLPAVYKDDRESRGVIEGRRVSASPNWEVRLFPTDGKSSNRGSHVARSQDGFWIRIAKTSREHFTGTVCNLETPSNTYLLSFIVHNCADLPPEFSAQDGTWTGYRLDGDKTHTASTLKRYGRHKAWVDPLYRYQGKPVILVYNAD